MHNSADIDSLRHLLPGSVGEITNVTPIRMGLSGAAVYVVSTATGNYILRVRGERFTGPDFAEDVRILRRASAAGVAPEVIHVDETARAILSRRIDGPPLPAALANPQSRDAAIASVVTQLRRLHAADQTGLPVRDPVAFARGIWETQRGRTGFPTWAAGVGGMLDRLAGLLGRDPRVVFSHNDVNPGNVMWDGTRAWLVDWDAAGLTHPYYDLASLTTFLDMDPKGAESLLEMQEQATLSDDARITFAGFRQLVGILCGMTPQSRARPLRARRADDGGRSDARRILRRPPVRSRRPAAAVRTTAVRPRDAEGRVALSVTRRRARRARVPRPTAPRPSPVARRGCDR